ARVERALPKSRRSRFNSTAVPDVPPPSTGVRFILFNSAQHPIEVAAGYLTSAVFADARHVDGERRSAVRAVIILVLGRLCPPRANKGPVFGIRPWSGGRSAQYAPCRIHGII